MNNNKIKAQKEMQDLVIRGKQGDNLAVEEVYKRLRGFIHKKAFKIYLREYELEDYVQIGNESIAKAYKNYKPQEDKPFLPYVTTAIEKNFYYLIRGNKKHKNETSLNAENDINCELIDTIPSLVIFEEDLLKREIYIKLNEIIKKYDLESREIIYYIFIKELKVSDFARLKNLDYWVCLRKVKALLRKLKNSLEEEQVVS